jgi:deoxyribodipyrimidine photo-lyase
MSPLSAPILVWFRQDLRLADHPALHAACATGRPVIPVFIWDAQGDAAWPLGGASCWWLHHSLTQLQQALEAKGSRLVLRQGPSLATLQALIQETGAQDVFWSRRYEPHIIARDTTIKETLHQKGLGAESFNAALLYEPWTVQNKSGKPFQVFTPFWKHCQSLPDCPHPLPEPSHLPKPKNWPKSIDLIQMKFLPKIPWDTTMAQSWQIGPHGAQKCLETFLENAWGNYKEERNRPDLPGTSRLSPYLHFGEISPRQIWHSVRQWAEKHGVDAWRTSHFLSEVGWREFAHHLLYHFPHTPMEPLRAEWQGFPVTLDLPWLKAWQHGRTGYPIVDAGMRELWATGWMHNRVRMIVASFLVKDLFLPWQEGARWFWDTLVDADLAQNTLGWQWTAGCGADAAPYFRIFNPISQGQKFDPHGHYVRRWVPEIAKLPNDYLHAPWEAGGLELLRFGITLGKNYPAPIVDHAKARERALAAYAALRGKD